MSIHEKFVTLVQLRISKILTDSIRKKLRTVGFVGPATFFYIAFFVVPTVALFGLSLFRYSGIGEIEFVGLQHYQAFFGDTIAHRAIWHNLQIALISFIFNFFVALGLAFMVKKSYDRLRQFFQTALLLPMAMMPVAVAFAWMYLYNPSYGFFNATLEILPYIESQPIWLGDPSIALYAIIIVGIWQWIGFNTIIWLAGLTSVDESLIEAARIDGAGKIQTVRYVVLPQLKPIAIFVFIFTFIGSFRTFEYYWVMTRGGPAHATEVMVTWIYKSAFDQSMLGYAAMLSVLLFFITFILAIVNYKLGEKTGSQGAKL